jgi:hypothetical protein
MSIVTLNISRTAQTGYTEATDVKPNRERKYYYKYTGGNTSNDNGDFTTPTGTPISFTVSLETPGYLIDKVKFSGSSNNDGSDVIAADKKSVVITDNAQHKGELKYTLEIEDTVDPGHPKNNTFDCDPKVINV